MACFVIHCAANLVGTSQQQISRLESPSYEGHSLSMLRRVSEVLGAAIHIKIQRKSHEHTNTIENISFYNYHIHKATERYQQIGAREDTYAEATGRFTNIEQAVSCLMNDCGFEIPSGTQRSLFGEAGI